MGRPIRLIVEGSRRFNTIADQPFHEQATAFFQALYDNLLLSFLSLLQSSANNVLRARVQYLLPLPSFPPYGEQIS